MKKQVYPFSSGFSEVGSFAKDLPNSIIKNEPMFFNCSIAHAYENGGLITRNFIESLPAELKHQKAVFDSRVHMLMPGWFPAIPGWHHDDIPRDPNNGGQPDYDDPSYNAYHIMGLVNGDICPTEFATGMCKLKPVPSGEIVYKQWHKEVQQLIDEGELMLEKAPDRTMIFFNQNTFHQGTQAVTDGWRWFGRVSYNTDRVNHITNEERRQVQVYLENPFVGW